MYNHPNMKLRPIDFSILAELTDGRNVAANLYMTLDSSRQYVNERMGLIHDYGLVRRVGPNENVGLYEITEKGLAVVDLREQYKNEDLDFEELVDEYLAGEADKDDLEDSDE